MGRGLGDGINGYNWKFSAKSGKIKGRGEMAEWSIATVLKTVERKFRGFESLSLL